MLRHSVYVDTVLDGNDKTAIRFTRFLIDGNDRHQQFTTITSALPREGAYGRERVRLTMEQPLEGQELYEIESYFEAINPIATKKAWTFSRKLIIAGYELTITDADERYHIELFGIGTDTYYSNRDENGARKRQIVVSQADEMLAPGMEFWLFVSSV